MASVESDLIAAYAGLHDAASSQGAAVAAAMINGWWRTTRADYDAEGNLTTAPADIMAARTAALTEIMAKIPNGATNVLDVGCGDGHLGVLIAENRPDITRYRGIDLCMENITSANTNIGGVAVPGGMTVEYAVANMWEHLETEITGGDWFIVSSRCLMEETRRGEDRQLMQLIDAKAALGWFLWGNRQRLLRPDMQYVMEQARLNSTTVVDHYFSEANPAPRNFLLTEMYYGDGPFAPVYLNRTGGYVEIRQAPPLAARQRVVANGTFERARAEVAVKQNTAATDYTGVTVVGGNITGSSVKTIASQDANFASRVETYRTNRVARVNKLNKVD